MTFGDVCVVGTALCQLGAAIFYTWKRQWVPAMIWIGGAIISIGTLLLTWKAK